MRTHVGYEKAVAALAQHGIDAVTDASALEAAIEARGWRLELERVDSGYRDGRPRFRALATRTHDPRRACSVSRSTRGGSARHVLVTMLAKVLEWDEAASSTSPGRHRP